ncbi:MAG: zinc ribbon domain-containing protein [Phycisphaerales bacterium]
MAERHLPIKRVTTNGEVVNRRALAVRDTGRDEGPSAADLEKFGGVTRTCPECGKEVFDDTSTCYHCGADLDAPRHARLPKTWVVVTVLAVIAAMIFFLIR